MEKDEINFLKKENETLRREIAKIVNSLKMESDSTTQHIKKIYQRIKLIDNYIASVDKQGVSDITWVCQRIADIHDIIAPIEDKIFPKAKSTRKQLKSIVGPRQLGAGENLDRRKR
jgi:hypothetical protein